MAESEVIYTVPSDLEDNASQPDRDLYESFMEALFEPDRLDEYASADFTHWNPDGTTELESLSELKAMRRALGGAFDLRKIEIIELPTTEAPLVPDGSGRKFSLGSIADFTIQEKTPSSGQSETAEGGPGLGRICHVRVLEWLLFGVEAGRDKALGRMVLALGANADGLAPESTRHFVGAQLEYYDSHPGEVPGAAPQAMPMDPLIDLYSSRAAFSELLHPPTQ